MTRDKLLTYATNLLGGPPEGASDWQQVAGELFQEHMDHQPRATRLVTRAAEHAEELFAQALAVTDCVPNDQSVQMSEEVAAPIFKLIMGLRRLSESVADAILGGERITTSLIIGPGGDMSHEDFARLAQLATAANEQAGAGQDKQLQRIETILDIALLEVEKKRANEPTGDTPVNVITLDLTEVAEEWQERVDEMSCSVPNTEGMSWGEVGEATTNFLAESEQADFVAQYTSFCRNLRLEPVEPDTLKHSDATLIREDTFEDYAREFASDLYGDLGPLESFVNWGAFADSLKQDYEEIEYDGHTWLRRA